MDSFKGRYSDNPFADSLLPPLPPPIESLEGEDSLLSPTVMFATGGTVSVATEATASSTVTGILKYSDSTSNSTTSTISDEENDYSNDMEEDNGTSHRNSNRGANNSVTRQSQNSGKGSSGRRNPFGAMRRRLGGTKSKACCTDKNSAEEDILHSQEQLAAAVGAALDGHRDEESFADNQLVEVKLKATKHMAVAPTNHYAHDISPVAAAFQSSAIVLTQAVADIGMAAAEAEAEANGWDVTICIGDTAGIPIQVKRNTGMLGTAVSYDMAVGKAKMASMFGKATGWGKAGGEGKELAMASMYPYFQLGGGVPLILNGSCCGAVGVSSGGLIGHADQEHDEQVAWAAIKAMTDLYWSYQVLAADAV
jgi:glc operon protein GlcG